MSARPKGARQIGAWWEVAGYTRTISGEIRACGDVNCRSLADAEALAADYYGRDDVDRVVIRVSESWEIAR